MRRFVHDCTQHRKKDRFISGSLLFENRRTKGNIH